MDYTKQRKSAKIQVCPKCGRKGFKRNPVIENKKINQRTYWQEYIHATNDVLGLAIVTDHCSTDAITEPIEKTIRMEGAQPR